MTAIASAPPAAASGALAPHPGIEAASAPPAPPAPGTIRLRVEHTMDAGRLVLRIDDRAILSAPLAALAGGGAGGRERDLSVAGGRHALTVQLIDARGRIVAQELIHANLGPREAATLLVAEHRGSGDGLTLSWRTP